MKKLDVEVSEELASLIDDAVDSGDYGNASAVIDQALRGWRAQREAGIAELRRLVQEGIDSGIEGPWRVDDIIEEGRALLRKAALRQAQGSGE